MKKLLYFFISLFIMASCMQYSDITSKQHRTNNKTIKATEVQPVYAVSDSLNQEIKTNDTLNNKQKSAQCKGVTKSGTRCKNKTLNKSGYCYLHENQNPEKADSTKTKPIVKTGTTKSGQQIYTGSRGGQFHYSKSGNKVYERKKK